jgi:class 3 adenylate cyclase
MKYSVDEFSMYDDFPVVNPSTHSIGTASMNISDEEVTFSGKRQNYCVCYIDMINSTKITDEMSESNIGKYYSIFLNTMALIAKNFGGKIMKNAGDCLIFYFPISSKSYNELVFKDIIECCLTMTLAHDAINAKLSKQNLPALNYRISADFGKLEVARSVTSNSEDFFGSTMNLCAKINAKALPNGIVIGQSLHRILKSFTFYNDYNFEEIGSYSIINNKDYYVYAVTSKEKRIILNPFARSATENTQIISEIRKNE